ncbi:hypothetical protein E4T48_04148 [Aureobasidium sp. EXF-10727]|nr:hypothetical protein E4T48_04148 [Aureobasidium sp. EXF-10727]
MSMDILPPELFASIVSLVVAKQKQVTKYATISRAWQRAIEEHYDDNACGRFERQADRHLNDKTFTEAITNFFTALATIDPGNGSAPINLHLLHFYSSMDINRRDEEKLRADKLARATGKRHDLFELRYRDSYLQLLDLENLPVLHSVTSLTIHGNTARKLAPAVTAGLISRLPNVAAVDCSFWDGERRRPDQRRQLRSELARQLTSLAAPASLRKFSLKLINREPGNSNFVDADIRGSCYPLQVDGLSTSLRLFSQAAPCLTCFSLTGPISVDANLFGSLEDTEPEIKQRWQKLERFIVELSAVRPDGGWYTEIDHERDPETSDDEDEEEDQDEDEDENEDEDTDNSSNIIHNDARSEDSSSGYDSSDSFFAMDQLPPDSYGYAEERRDAIVNGDEPSTSPFRTKPAPELEAFFLAAARAASQMPRLKSMNVGHKIRPSERTGRRFRTLGFEYLAKGVKYPGDGADVLELGRLYWSVGRGWRMSQELDSQWRLLLGDDGIVKYNEW